MISDAGSDTTSMACSGDPSTFAPLASSVMVWANENWVSNEPAPRFVVS